jgi:hypothetical protein
MNQQLVKGSITNGVMNAVINGGIQYFSFRKLETIPISVDSITNNDLTVLGSAVNLALMLAMVLTLVAYFTIKKSERPPFKNFIWLILKHGFFTFGVATALAVLWQYNFGTIEVSPIAATVIVGIIAGVVAGVVNYLTVAPYTKEEE